MIDKYAPVAVIMVSDSTEKTVVIGLLVLAVFGVAGLVIWMFVLIRYHLKDKSERK